MRIRAMLNPELDEIGALAGGDLYRLQLADRSNEPVLTQWDAWGERIDEVAGHSIVVRSRTARGRNTAWSRPGTTVRSVATRASHNLRKVYLFHPSSDVYTCPLAMSDGAVRTLLASGNQELIDRAVPHLLSRDLAQSWTSGQWMTETTGGSDVGRSETRAVPDRDGWRLYGRKWFTSAVTSQMALTLARPEGNAPGGKGLAMFYVEMRDAAGQAQRHPRRSAQGQARHAQGADGRADARRHARDAGRRRRPTAPVRSSRCWPSRACGTASAPWHSCAAGWRWRARMRPNARPSASRSRSCRCTPTRSRRSKPRPGARS